MKIYARLAEMSDIEYLKSNNMYQTAMKYMGMLKELGLLEGYPWKKTLSGNPFENVVTVIVFHEMDDDEDDRAIAASCYHPYNNEEYTRLPYSTDKDIALTIVDDRHRGEVSFVFHENGVGEYNEIRFLAGDYTRNNPKVEVSEI